MHKRHQNFYNIRFRMVLLGGGGGGKGANNAQHKMHVRNVRYKYVNKAVTLGKTEKPTLTST